VAQYITRRYRPDEPGKREDIRVRPHDSYVWVVPVEGSPPRCSQCRRPIDPFTDKDLDWSKVLLPKEEAPESVPPILSTRAKKLARKTLADLADELGLPE
jgi:hypothetical protein